MIVFVISISLPMKYDIECISATLTSKNHTFCLLTKNYFIWKSTVFQISIQNLLWDLRICQHLKMCFKLNTFPSALLTYCSLHKPYRLWYLWQPLQEDAVTNFNLFMNLAFGKTSRESAAQTVVAVIVIVNDAFRLNSGIGVQRIQFMLMGKLTFVT